MHGAGSTFALNVYPEPFTPAGVKAKGFKFTPAGVKRGALVQTMHRKQEEIDRRFLRPLNVRFIIESYWIVAGRMTPRQDPCQESSSVTATGTAVIRRTPSPSQTE